MPQLFNHVPLATPLPELHTEEIGGKRYYITPEGLAYPSITTVLSVLSKDPIDAWRKRIGEEEAARISAHASGRGTDLHSVIEAYLKNEELPFPTDPKSRVRIMFNRMKQRLSNINDISAQEIPLYSDRLKVAGRCDCIAKWNGVPSIIDFKSATKAKIKAWINGYFIQTTGYSLMYEERTGIKVDQVVILMAGEDDFSCQAFVEKRDAYISQVSATIDLFNAEVLAGAI